MTTSDNIFFHLAIFYGFSKTQLITQTFQKKCQQIIHINCMQKVGLFFKKTPPGCIDLEFMLSKCFIVKADKFSAQLQKEIFRFGNSSGHLLWES